MTPSDDFLCKTKLFLGSQKGPKKVRPRLDVHLLNRLPSPPWQRQVVEADVPAVHRATPNRFCAILLSHVARDTLAT